MTQFPSVINGVTVHQLDIIDAKSTFKPNLKSEQCFLFSCLYCSVRSVSGDARCACGCKQRVDCRFSGSNTIKTFLLHTANANCKRLKQANKNLQPSFLKHQPGDKDARKTNNKSDKAKWTKFYIALASMTTTITIAVFVTFYLRWRGHGDHKITTLRHPLPLPSNFDLGVESL